MQKTLTLPIKLISVNSMYYGNRRQGKTQEAKDWFYTVFHELGAKQNAESLAELRDLFDCRKHFYSVEIRSTVPKQLFFNKEGSISSRTIDLSNCEKALIDAIFLRKYYGPKHPYECFNLNTDDKYIASLLSKKQPGETWSVEVQISIEDLSQIRRP